MGQVNQEPLRMQVNQFNRRPIRPKRVRFQEANIAPLNLNLDTNTNKEPVYMTTAAGGSIRVN